MLIAKEKNTTLKLEIEQKRMVQLKEDLSDGENVLMLYSDGHSIKLSAR